MTRRWRTSVAVVSKVRAEGGGEGRGGRG